MISAYSDLIQFKHATYKYESEVRLIVSQQNEQSESSPMGIRLIVPDLNRIIRTLVVSPETNPGFIELVKNLVTKYELTTQVLDSNLTKAVV